MPSLKLNQWLSSLVRVLVVGLAVSGTALHGQRVNLALFQAASADSNASGEPALYATDGIVSKHNRWKSDGAGPHWLKITLPLAMEIGSAQVFTGSDDNNAIANFVLQYLQDGRWLDIPGTRVTGNTSTELNLVFDEPVTASEFRLYTTDSTARVKELALYPPHGPAGYPLGTDLVLNLAWMRETTASSVDGDDYAKRAVDGYLDNNSRWVAPDNAEDDTLEVTLSGTHKIGSAHVYTGYGTGSPPMTEFKLQYWNGSAWMDIPGTHVTGNTQLAVRLDFPAPVNTSKVRLVSPGAGRKRLQELVLFTANGGAGYPLGTSVHNEPRPRLNFHDYGDAYHRIINRGANHSLVSSSNGAALARALDPQELRHFQVLLNVGTDTYRIRNRVSGDCLVVLDASRQSGAPIVERPYTGMPHQQWRIETVEGSYVRIVNVWSGMVLSTANGATQEGTAIVQATYTGIPTQQWEIRYQTHYPKKGLAGWFGQADRFQPSWGYNWGRADGTLSNGGLEMPMQHNAYWPGWGSLPEKYPVWNSRSRPTFMLGFNEPDRPDQADMSVDQALELWPRLERLFIPLVSPVTANPWNSWMTSFMDRAGNLGYRIEYVAVHWYGSPNGGNPQGFINWLNNIHNQYGKPLWLTEFSTVDWNGNATWTEEDNYNFFAEFFWRAENLDWLTKYSMFIFSGNGPSQPDARTAPRGNIFYSDNSTLTPLGELYAAWDGDTTIHEETPYLLHNKKQRKRIRNTAGANSPDWAWIRQSDDAVQWALVRAGVSRYYLVSLLDGKRLGSDGSNVTLTPPGTIGPAVEWDYVHDQHGWYYLEHPATRTRLQLNDQLEFHMSDNSQTWEGLKWRFIKPVAPSSFDPTPPEPPQERIVPAGSTWRYWDRGSLPAVDWALTSYDDRAWPSGPARLGYGGDGERTVLSFGPDPQNKHVSYYFRRAFTIDDPTRYARMILRLQRDDGAVVYLNGREIFRSNMPEGAVTPTTPASDGIGGELETDWFSLQLEPTLFRSGTNVLAAEVHQASPTSSDIGFDLELIGVLPPPAPEVRLLTPIDGGLFGTPGVVPIEAEAGDTQSHVLRVDFYLDGAMAGADTDTPYTLELRDLPAGLHTLSAAAVNAFGSSATSAVIRFQVVPLVRTNIIIPQGTSWKYHDAGVDLGTAWREPDYDDSNWRMGTAVLGFGDNPTTPINIGPDGARFLTAYFRRPFMMPPAAEITALHFRVLRDDGVVVYLNSTELFRMNMPEGPITFSTPASATVSGADESTYYEISTPASALVGGLNVLAVELHQAGLNTSDAAFDLEMTAEESLAYRYPVRLSVSREPDGTLRLSWISPTPDWQLYQALTVDPNSRWVPVPYAVEANSGHYSTVVPATATQRFYRLQAR